MITAKAAALESYIFTHNMTAALVKDWPADKWTAQPAGLPNHALWTLGHLAASVAFFASIAGVSVGPVPENYNTLFGMGAKPTADSAAYPPAVEIIAHYERTFKEFCAAIEKLSDAELAEPSAKADSGFVKLKIDALSRAAWHEGWHAGQVSLTRKAIGLPGIMG
jgi:hypothetical protein